MSYHLLKKRDKLTFGNNLINAEKYEMVQLMGDATLTIYNIKRIEKNITSTLSRWANGSFLN